MVKKPFGQTKVGNFIKKTGIVSKALQAGAKLAGETATGLTGNATIGMVADKGVGALANYAKQKGWGINVAGRPMTGYGKKTRKSKIIGSRRQVWHGTMQKTSGGLTKSDLMLNKRGRIVSKKKHAFGATKGRQFLVKAGYDPKKGSFKLFPKKR
jgi:hypothetical protein